MKKRLFSVLLALAMVVGTIPIFAAGTAEETEASVTLSAGSRQMEYLNPVSYTHLDVYKRQMFPSLPSF